MSDYAIVKHYRHITTILVSMVYGIGLYWYHEPNKTNWLFISFVLSVLAVVSSVVFTEYLLKQPDEKKANECSEMNFCSLRHISFLLLVFLAFAMFFIHLIKTT